MAASTIKAAVLPGARPALGGPRLLQSYTDVCSAWRTEEQLPVVYHPRYNITLWGLEKLHPFDSCKFKKVEHGACDGPSPRPNHAWVGLRQASFGVLTPLY